MFCATLRSSSRTPGHVIYLSSLLPMAFQGLISGAECATPSNPLSQVLKHTEGDRSIQQVSTHILLEYRYSGLCRIDQLVLLSLQ